MAVTKRSYMDILLGLFVAGGLGLLVAFIFLLGQEKRLFESNIEIKARFPNVAGLREGAQVLLGGVAIGHVSEILFPEYTTGNVSGAKALSDEDRKLITVIMRVSAKRMGWIKEDSVAQIDSEGLLGNKNINITLGSIEAKEPPNGLIRSGGPSGLNDAVDAAKNAARKIGDFFEAMNTGGSDKSLAATLVSLKNIIGEVEKGNGIVHRVIYDKKAGSDFSASLASLTQTIDSVRKTAAHIDGVLAELENGKGILHTLIYDSQGQEMMASAHALVTELESVAKSVRTGTGLLHNIIYEQDNGRMIENLNSFSADLQKIVSRVKDGEGTLGRLLVDPTIFEELKLILSDVKRNKLLKTLIRFGISLNETPNE